MMDEQLQGQQLRFLQLAEYLLAQSEPVLPPTNWPGAVGFQSSPVIDFGQGIADARGMPQAPPSESPIRQPEPIQSRGPPLDPSQPAYYAIYYENEDGTIPNGRDSARSDPNYEPAESHPRRRDRNRNRTRNRTRTRTRPAHRR